jgi:uncharacterized protein involved in type VI secretion and phage assembly
VSYDQLGDDDSGGLHGVFVGIVTNNEDAEGLGRVKLKFPWRDAEDESAWARIAVPMAGSEYGTYYLPEVDDEVLVAFEDGDIHAPYVLGSLWNGQSKPPADNTDGENNERTVTSRSGHAVSMNDSDEEGAITIETAAGHTITLDDGGEGITIADSSGSNSVEFDGSGGEISITAANKISLSANEIQLDGTQGITMSGQAVSISGQGKVELSSSAQLAISSQGMLDLDATGMMNIKSSAILAIKGSLIQLN